MHTFMGKECSSSVRITNSGKATTSEVVRSLGEVYRWDERN